MYSHPPTLPETSGRTFVVEWTGQADANGSGTASYDLFVSTNGAPFALWAAETTNIAAVFTGTIGEHYAFYVVGRDNVGNLESTPSQPDAETTVIADAPTFAAVDLQTIDVGGTITVTNTVEGAGNYEYRLAPDAPLARH